jgi:hypothetical protein
MYIYGCLYAYIYLIYTHTGKPSHTLPALIFQALNPPKPSSHWEDQPSRKLTTRRARLRCPSKDGEGWEEKRPYAARRGRRGDARGGGRAFSAMSSQNTRLVFS